MEKHIGNAMAVGGAVLVIASFVSLGYPDYGKWFPFLLIGGAALGWFGYKRIRWA
jgi:hypothetical protein